MRSLSNVQTHQRRAQHPVMRCLRCQHDNRQQAKFCEECGNPWKGVNPTAASYADPKTELESLRQALTEALEQQTATAKILRVMTTSATQLGPVLATVATTAARLCDAFDAVIFLVDGTELPAVAHHGPIPVPVVSRDPILSGYVTGRAVLERRTVHLADVQAETSEFPEASEYARQAGHRTILAVPLMR